MRLKQEIAVSVGGLIALQMLSSVLAIALLVRMGPAIRQILDENVYSGQAVEEMLVQVISQESSAPSDAFVDAWQRATDNVTEPEEQPLLNEIERLSAPAFAGDNEARGKLAATLQQLGNVNRESMVRADSKARRLGLAGAWGLALLGSLALALALFVHRRIILRFVEPVAELARTTNDFRRGERHVRCPTSVAPVEVQQISKGINFILDDVQQAGANTAANTAGQRPDGSLRRAFCVVLDTLPNPAMLVDESNKPVAQSLSAMDIAANDPRWTFTPIESTGLQLATLSNDTSQ